MGTFTAILEVGIKNRPDLKRMNYGLEIPDKTKPEDVDIKEVWDDWNNNTENRENNLKYLGIKFEDVTLFSVKEIWT